jgi:hypothetical protein
MAIITKLGKLKVQLRNMFYRNRVCFSLYVYVPDSSNITNASNDWETYTERGTILEATRARDKSPPSKIRPSIQWVVFLYQKFPLTADVIA